MCLTFHRRVAHFFGIPKRKSIYTKHLCLLRPQTNLFFPGLPNLGDAEIIEAWEKKVCESKLDAPKIGIPLSKLAQNTPCNYSVYLLKRFYERFIRHRLTNHGSSTFRLSTHPLFFVFLIMNKIYLHRWKQNSRDISNCNI